MEKVLLVANSKSSRQQLLQLLKEASISFVIAVQSGGEARRMLLENDFLLVLINTPLQDEFGEELATMVTENSTAGVILLVKNEWYEDILMKVGKYGVLIVAKPLQRQIFYQSLQLVTALRRRRLGLQKENLKLQQQVVEIKMVDRAKCLLIEHLRLTEAEAHRYIEKKRWTSEGAEKRLQKAL